MPGETIKIASSTGGRSIAVSTFRRAATVPAVVFASAIHSIDQDLIAIADEFARTATSPPLPISSAHAARTHDARRQARRRARAGRAEKIKAGEADLADTLAHLHTLSNSTAARRRWASASAGPTP